MLGSIIDTPRYNIIIIIDNSNIWCFMRENTAEFESIIPSKTKANLVVKFRYEFRYRYEFNFCSE
jgi:hypothetical protein